MLDYLKDKKDVGFFLSLQALMQTCRYMSFTVFYFNVNFKMKYYLFDNYVELYQYLQQKGYSAVLTIGIWQTVDVWYKYCVLFVDSVLDLNAFERQNKAEGLGMVSEEGSSESNYTENIT